MRLSNQIVVSVVAITILAQVLSAGIAYWINGNSHSEAHISQLRHIAETISKNWQPVRAEASIESYLQQLHQQLSTPNSLLLFQDKNGSSHIARNMEMDTATIVHLLEKSFDQKTSGLTSLEINEHRYNWAMSKIPDSANSIIMLEDVNYYGKGRAYSKLGIRLFTIGVIVLWLAVWVAVVISSIINRRIKEKNDALNYQALHDKLTGLPNRTLLQDRLDQAQFTAKRRRENFALLVFGLDNFRDVNDALGHHSGDKLLKEVSKRFEESMRDDDFLARLGGDEFAMILPKMDYDGAHACIARLLSVLKEPFSIEDTHVECKASIGVSLYPQHGEDSETLLKHANVAMYHAKKIGYNYAFYDTKYDFNTVHKLKQKNELRKAIDANNIDVYYQPMIDQKTSCPVMVEALARWNHHEHGFISPEEFIHTAEKTGSIHKLTMLVIRKALTDCRQWHALGHQITIAVNISTYCLQDELFPEKLMSIVNDTGMSICNIELEITESALMQDVGKARKMLYQLHQAGFKLVIDDFGTGYSSLAYLKDFPVSTLKIDRSFVSNMCVDEGNAAIVHSVIGLAHNLHCQVIAEGVEDKQTLEHLYNLGNDIAQGYYFSKPLPNEELIDWLNNSACSLHDELKKILPSVSDNISTG
jgi:diguanylate cyclase (GGDEF)-like protein